MNWQVALQSRRVHMPWFADLAKYSRRDPTIGFFWCLATLHVIFWTVLATLTQPNLPAETLEMLTSGREFAWGYAGQPPMGVWLASTVSMLAAPSNWPVYMLAQLCGMVSVWSAWQLARQFLHPWTALCAAFVLLGGYSCTIAASAFTGDQLAGAFWSLSILQFHNALTHQRRRYWALTGLFLAMGLLSSYGTLLLILTMFIFTLVDDRARNCWDSSWPFLAGMAMIALVMPHLVWLTRHQFLTVQAGIERSASFTHHLVQPLSFLGTQLLCVIPVVLILTPLVAWFSFEEPARTESDDGRDFARRYLLWMTCLPPAIIFALSLVAGPSSGLFAGVTNWSYLGVAVLMWGHLSETRLSWRRSIIRIGTAVGLFAAALIALNIMVPQIQRQGASTQFPGAELSQRIESIWNTFGYAGRTLVVGGPSDLVRNAAWYSQNGGIKGYADLDPTKNPSINDETLRRDGGVIVWSLDSDRIPTASELQQRFGNVTLVNPVDLNWKSDAGFPVVRVGMAVVHPANALLPNGVPANVTPANASYPSPDLGTPISTVPTQITPPTYSTSTPTYQSPAYPTYSPVTGPATTTPVTTTPSNPNYPSTIVNPPAGQNAGSPQYSGNMNSPGTKPSVPAVADDIMPFESSSFQATAQPSNGKPSNSVTGGGVSGTGTGVMNEPTASPTSPSGAFGVNPTPTMPAAKPMDSGLPGSSFPANYPAATYPLNNTPLAPTGTSPGVGIAPSVKPGNAGSEVLPLSPGSEKAPSPTKPSTLEDIWTEFKSSTSGTKPAVTPATKPALPVTPKNETPIDLFNLGPVPEPTLAKPKEAPTAPQLPTQSEREPGLTEN